MITVGGSVLNVLTVMIVAALSGAVGGFAYELLQSRGKDTGAIERSREFKQGSRRFYDLGWGASVILGAIVAVAGLYIFPPLQQVSVTVDGQATTTLSYDLIKVVALSLILGSASGSVMSSLQGRVLAAVNQQKAQVVEAVGKAQVEQVKNNIRADAEKDIQNTLQRNLLPELKKIAADNPAADPQKTAQALTEQVASRVVEAVQERIDDHTEAAQETLDKTVSAISAG